MAETLRSQSLSIGLRALRVDTPEEGSTDVLDNIRKDTATTLDTVIENAYIQAEEQRFKVCHSNLLKDVFNISPVLTDAASALVDDSFLRCFTSQTPDPWNWNFYLFPIWCLGSVVRHLIIFPLRLLFLLTTLLIFMIMFFSLSFAFKDSDQRKIRAERALVQWMCGMFVASWTGVVKFHGPRPTRASNRVWVANHTSMIDYIILCSYSPFAVIMQLHPGWVGFLQTKVLSSLGCLWFNRTQVTDRTVVARRMREHVNSEDPTPLLIFPEGTCVNNEYCVMFKRGAFDLGCTVCPIAIKYNKIFVDGFWNSKRFSFTTHLYRIMTSWALVCDVYFLEPQVRRADETADDFAKRVQALIAHTANLRVVPWDGYLKYYNLGEKHPQLIEKRRKVFADQLRQYLPKSVTPQESSTDPAAAAADAAAAANDSVDKKNL